MPKGLQPKGVIRRNKMLLAAVQMFLEKGYDKTTTAAIAKKAGMWYNVSVKKYLRMI